jgi:hypothetical protein
MVQAAAVGTSLLLAAACAKPGTGNGTLGGGGDGQGVGGLAISAGALIVSDGTKVVRVGDQQVTFPSTVTDAAVSPDGSRLAYVDGDNNITVSQLDGTGQLVLTKTTPGVTRSRPTWQSASIAFAEKRPDGTSTLMLAEANGCDYGQTKAVHEVSMDTGDNTSYVDLAPSSADRVGTGVRLAFQHEEPSGPEVWITDSISRGYSTEKIDNGTDPVLSPDGTKLAYVATSGQIVMRAKIYENKTIQLTFGAAKPTRLTWSPDGSHIAFRTATDIESVAVDVPAGANANPATVAANAPGVPTFVRPRQEAVNRITGADPIALAIAVSQAYYPTVPKPFQSQGFSGAHSVTLTAPANAGGGSAGRDGYGPLLFTGTDALDPRTLAELQRLFGPAPQGDLRLAIKIVGGTDVISAKVESDLKGKGYDVTRAASTTGPGTSPGADPCSYQASADYGLAKQVLVVVNKANPTNVALAEALGGYRLAPVLEVDPAAGLTDAAKQWLIRSSAALNATYLVDPDGSGIPAELEQQITSLISGPLGADTATNPTVPPIND